MVIGNGPVPAVVPKQGDAFPSLAVKKQDPGLTDRDLDVLN
jgi:hypothetical protein